MNRSKFKINFCTSFFLLACLLSVKNASADTFCVEELDEVPHSQPPLSAMLRTFVQSMPAHQLKYSLSECEYILKPSLANLSESWIVTVEKRRRSNKEVVSASLAKARKIDEVDQALKTAARVAIMGKDQAKEAEKLAKKNEEKERKLAEDRSKQDDKKNGGDRKEGHGGRSTVTRFELGPAFGHRIGSSVVSVHLSGAQTYDLGKGFAGLGADAFIRGDDQWLGGSLKGDFIFKSFENAEALAGIQLGYAVLAHHWFTDGADHGFQLGISTTYLMFRTESVHMSFTAKFMTILTSVQSSFPYAGALTMGIWF